MSWSRPGGPDTIEIPPEIDGIPNISGSESAIQEFVRMSHSEPAFLAPGQSGFGNTRSAFAIALHMHQPLIPAGGRDLQSAPVISNLQWMLEHPDIGDNHNAPVFLWCYKRMGEFIPQLIDEGLQPRVMLEYSGTLLYGLRQMGAHDVLDALMRITTKPRNRTAVEWLGCTWGHAVAPSTPVQDFRLHVQAWQQYFAALFGADALRRVRGFSPSEMALPNEPDVAYEFVKTLLDCGYKWVLVQEHTIEQPDGAPPRQRHLPHRLMCTSSRGETATITAVIKTQGSDTKLVGQMQPYYEARGLSRQEVAGQAVPPLVTQIADGENGGVMMNEFPPKYFEVIRECSGSDTPIMNVTEYLERLESSGIRQDDLPVIQPLFQSRIWQRMRPGDGPQRLAGVITQLRLEDGRFHMEGGSWTNNISWVNGYESVLVPMDRASSLFHERMSTGAVDTGDPRFRNALFHLLTAETSCYRYWGQGIWTDYGAELARRAINIINQVPDRSPSSR
jgi:Glycosyl hydrolase family 57